MRSAQQLLNKVTMYQLTLLVLGFFVLTSLILSFFDLIAYRPTELAVSLLVLLVTSVGVHYFCAKLTKAPANLDSTVISALILFFLFTPSVAVGDLLVLALVAVITVVGKYLVAYRHLHIFNPVALTAVIVALFGLTYATWWVATPWLTPVVLLGGLLITLKIRRLDMVATGILVATVVFVAREWWQGSLDVEALVYFFTLTPLLFFFTVMVTEPLSTPGQRAPRLVYVAFIGLFINIPFTLGPLFSSPELVLLIANTGSFALSMKSRLLATVEEVQEIAKNTYEYTFSLPKKIEFQAGQYFEWTLPHRARDGRGARRFFSASSAPGSDHLSFAVRFVEQGSSFKKYLQGMNKGDEMYVTGRAGDFLLPSEPTPLLFVAGGIGVTPFISQIRYLSSSKQNFNIVLLYACQSLDHLAFKEELQEAESRGLRCIPVIENAPEEYVGYKGRITPKLLQEAVPDYQSRHFYISGSPGMVDAIMKVLRSLSVPRRAIKTDYFPGLS